jgi:uncharacterized protein (DUF433 family)
MRINRSRRWLPTPINFGNVAKHLSAESIQGDLIQTGHSLFAIVWINPERMAGAPCFAGTRVPIKNLFDYLESNYAPEQFPDGFDGISRERAVAVIELAHCGLLGDIPQP